MFSLSTAPQAFSPKNNQNIFLTIVYSKIARYAAPQAPEFSKIESVKAIFLLENRSLAGPKVQKFRACGANCGFF